MQLSTSRLYDTHVRTYILLKAVDSQIAVDPGLFDVFLSVLAKQPYMSDLYNTMKLGMYSKSVGQLELTVLVWR